MMSNVNELSLLYVLPAIIAGSVNALVWWDAVADYRWAEAEEDIRPSRFLTARDQLTLHSFLLSVQIVFLVIGMVSFAFLPEPPITPARLVFIAGLMLIEVMLAAAAIITRWNWRQTLRLIERSRKRQEEREAGPS